MIKFLTKSIILATLIIITAIIIGFIIYSSSILLWSSKKTETTYDAIIVLTGSAGRIETGFSLLLDKKADRLLISGVVEGTSFKDIINANSKKISDTERTLIANHCCIDLDYIADTTFTNAIESQKWIGDNDIKSIILVTSDYHMPRAYLNFTWVLPNDIKIKAAPYYKDNRLSLVMSHEFWHHAVKEYIKFGGTFIRLIQH